MSKKLTLNPRASEFVPGGSFGSAPTTTPTPAPTQPEPTKESWEDSADQKNDQPAGQPKAEAKPVEKPKAEEISLDDKDDDDRPLTAEELKELERLKIEEGLEKGDGEIVFKEEVVDDPREHLNIVFIGHVDAGKSTVCGNILVQTGQVDERTIQKYEKEAKENNRGSWFFAYIMDINDEERAKGKTVEVGRAQFETEKKRYTILDAPGHKNYVPNMLMGVAQADVGVLIISAKKGEFESGFDKNGQTREHAILAKTLGLKKLVVAVNKVDEPTVNYDKARYDEICNKITPFLKQFGYNMKDVTFLPMSGYTGQNILNKFPTGVCSWYQGESLIGTLDAMDTIERNETAPLRVPVLDKFKERGVLFVMGKVESGTVKRGDTCVLMPGRIPVEVLSLSNDKANLSHAKPGENIRIGLKGVEEDHVHRGFVLCAKEAPVHVVSEFVAQVVFMDLLSHKSLFTAGYQAVIHMHTAVEEITCVRVLAELDKKTGQVEKKLPKFVNSKSLAVIHFQLAKDVCMEAFSDIQQLGRFTMRDEGKTIAFGKVLYIGPPKKKSAK
jgi:peptide chain release factor subunit 3